MTSISAHYTVRGACALGPFGRSTRIFPGFVMPAMLAGFAAYAVTRAA